MEGAFDTTGVERFMASIVHALEARSVTAVDADGLTFIHSSGLSALLRSRAAARVAGVDFRMSDRPGLRRAIDAAGIEDPFR